MGVVSSRWRTLAVPAFALAGLALPGTALAQRYTFFRDDALDARDPLAPRKDPQRQWQYGLSAGGPLRRDQTFVFANLEQTRLDRSGTITIPEPTIETINATLLARGYRGPLPRTGLFRTGYDSTNLLLRADHELGSQVHAALRYSLYHIDSDNARNVGGINTESRGTAIQDTDLMLEGFNVLNRSNLLLPNNVFGPGSTPRPGFGDPTAVSAARQLQIGLRVRL